MTYTSSVYNKVDAMKIKSEKKNLKIILIILLGVVICVSGYGIYAHHFAVWPFQKPAVSSSQDNPDMSKANNSIKEQSANQAKDSSKNVGSDQPEPPKTSSGAQKPTVAMDITAASVSSGTLMIRTFIEYVTSDGKCTLNMTGPNGATYTATADVQAASSSASCKGFNVPTSSLGAGAWTITINFENNNVSGSATKNITL